MTETMTESTEVDARPFYAADLVAVRESDGYVLLVKRGWAPYKGCWALPGGHVGTRETALAATVREGWEETAVRVSPEALTLVSVNDGPDRDPRDRYVGVAYMATVPAGTTATAGDDAEDVCWVPLDAPGEGLEPGEELAFDHAQILRAAWRQRVAAERLRALEEATDGRCPAAHPRDSSACSGLHAVTVVDGAGVGVDACEHHAALMLASISSTARVHDLFGAEGSAARVRAAAAALPPYAWRQQRAGR